MVLALWIWDFIVVLLAFCLFSGVTDMSGPTLGAAAFAACAHFGFFGRRIPLEDSRLSRFLLRVWNRFEKRLARRPGSTLTLLTLFYGLRWTVGSLRRHAAFGSSSFDLGIFTQAIWNLTHGNGYVSTLKGGMNLFADHQSPLFWVLAPIFAAAPRPETLLAIQGFGLAAGGGALFYLGRQYGLKGWRLAALPLLYWMDLPIRNANAFDFHPEVLMMPLFLWAIVGLQSVKLRGRILGALAFLLALAAKESAGYVAAGAGLGWAFGAGPENTRSWTRKLGWGAMAAGAGIFLFDVAIVPRFFGRTYAYAELYGFHSFKNIFGLSRLKLLLRMLAPLAFLPLWNWRAAIAAVPAFLALFIADGDLRVNPMFHYGIEPTVALLWAVPGALVRLKDKRLWAGVLFVVLAASGRGESYRARHFRPTPHEQWLALAAIPRVNPNMSVAASNALVPHLATRKTILLLPEFRDANGVAVDCVIKDSSVNEWPTTAQNQAELPMQLKGAGYREEWSCGNFRVYSRGRVCLKTLPNCD